MHRGGVTGGRGGRPPYNSQKIGEKKRTGKEEEQHEKEKMKRREEEAKEVKEKVHWPDKVDCPCPQGNGCDCGGEQHSRMQSR